MMLLWLFDDEGVLDDMLFCPFFVLLGVFLEEDGAERDGTSTSEGDFDTVVVGLGVCAIGDAEVLPDACRLTGT